MHSVFFASIMATPEEAVLVGEGYQEADAAGLAYEGDVAAPGVKGGVDIERGGEGVVADGVAHADGAGVVGAVPGFDEGEEPGGFPSGEEVLGRGYGEAVEGDLGVAGFWEPGELRDGRGDEVAGGPVAEDFDAALIGGLSVPSPFELAVGVEGLGFGEGFEVGRNGGPVGVSLVFLTGGVGPFEGVVAVLEGGGVGLHADDAVGDEEVAPLERFGGGFGFGAEVAVNFADEETFFGEEFLPCFDFGAGGALSEDSHGESMSVSSDGECETRMKRRIFSNFGV